MNKSKDVNFTGASKKQIASFYYSAVVPHSN